MPEDDATNWPDVQRLESFAGELRMNLIRLLAIALFYGRHLAEALLGPADSPARGAYHVRVTMLCLIWAGAAIVLHLWLVRRNFADWIKFVATIFDASMITMLIMLAGGPKSALVLLYFPLIASAPLRLSLKLVYVATIAAGVGYLCVLAQYAWFVVGFQKYYSTPDLRIPRSQEAIVLLALLVTGVLGGQFVRQARRIAAAQPMILAAGGAR